MYESLVNWCKQDIVVHRKGELLPSGEHAEDMCFTVKGLLVDDSKQVIDKDGQMVLCRSYVYVVPDRVIHDTDMLQLPNDTRKFEIRKLGGYYDGNTGKLSVQVAYI